MVYETCPYCGHLAGARKESAGHDALAAVRRQMAVHLSKCIANPKRSKAVTLHEPEIRRDL